eukprot:TRINITY_DN6754_c0_g2_i7.p1 TRINITY_DN6754_c0_g2~~TRINITY_DN6754_c0_g2_i7.p1  ORF type:complete len:228 (-),score=39.38 TRINITY_DN6754_c0_g2_i7:28-711(-)
MTMLASTCPGWICYAEKRHGEYILPYLSDTKSPQQIMGSIIKDYHAKRLGVNPADIYHVTIMMCYDKKLEASRDDFYDTVLRTRDVDTVLTSSEIETLLMEKGIDFPSLEESPLDPLYVLAPSRYMCISFYTPRSTNLSLSLSLSPRHRFSNITPEGQLYHPRGESGNTLESVYRFAAAELFNIPVEDIVYKTLRNEDMREVVLEVCSISFPIARMPSYVSLTSLSL